MQTKGRTTLTVAIRKYLAFSFFIIFLLDYSSKLIVLKYLGPNPKKLIGNFLTLNLTINNGAAFSIGNGSGPAFGIFAVAFLGVIFYVGRKIDSNKWAIALGILAGGVCGNLVDRIFRAPGHLRGGVVDWIQFPHWPIFNVADIAIDIGFLFIGFLLIKKVPLDSKRLRNG